MKFALVTTTINVTEVLRDYRELGPDVEIIVAGDLRTDSGCEELVKEIGGHYLSPEAQSTVYPGLSDAIGWNCVQRRNIAILEAAKLGPDVIVSVDDDNHPTGDYFTELEAAFSSPHTGHVATGDWFNVGELADEQFTYRGYPYSLTPQAAFGLNGKPRKIGVVNGLIYGDPDINATQRLEFDPKVLGYKAALGGGIAVDPQQTRTPINAQNTAYRAELAPLMLQLPHVGRYDDIWGSYIAQRVLEVTDYHVLFGEPSVRQDRNEHDIICDLEQEVFGMRHTEQLLEALGETYATGSIIEALRAVLSGLVDSPVVLPHDFFSEWLAAWETL